MPRCRVPGCHGARVPGAKVPGDTVLRRRPSDGAKADDNRSNGGAGLIVDSQHAADLELARLCASGDEQAWERFVRDYRPVLYRAAQALDATGAAREIADSLYAELFGVRGRSGESLPRRARER